MEHHVAICTIMASCIAIELAYSECTMSTSVTMHVMRSASDFQQCHCIVCICEVNKVQLNIV